jgi:histidine ammonia-lyase
MTVVLTGDDLTVDDVLRVARNGEPTAFAPEALERMAASRAVVEQVLETDTAVYGMTTGVGVRKRVRVPREEVDDFNRTLILNHRIAQGDHAPDDVVSATLLRLANGLAKGTAGVRPELAQRVLDTLNERRLPVVHTLGSVGQADLGPMADLAHGLLGDFPLAAKEGLALLNNNAFSTAGAALAIADARRLLAALDVGGALDLEAFCANVSVLHAAVADLRPYPGLRASRERIVELLEGSFLWGEASARNLQDPITFRGVAHVNGAARDVLDYALRQLEIELNASQDNPIVVVGEGRIVSVANFEILPLAAALDFLRIGLAPALTSACERLVKLMQAPLTGLPEGLAVRDGLVEDSLTELSIAAQSLTAEARLLAQPVSYELASSSHAEGIEDRMTMAPLAARRLAELVELGERVLAIGLVISTQALDLRGPPRLGRGTRRAYKLVRDRIPFVGEGEPVPADLEPVRDLIRSGPIA